MLFPISPLLSPLITKEVLELPQFTVHTLRVLIDWLDRTSTTLPSNTFVDNTFKAWIQQLSPPLLIHAINALICIKYPLHCMFAMSTFINRIQNSKHKTPIAVGRDLHSCLVGATVDESDFVDVTALVIMRPSITRR
jgi:hypothetical protein